MCSYPVRQPLVNRPENNLQELVLELQELVLEAQRHPPRSPQRLGTVDRIIKLILEPGFLGYPSLPYYLPQNRYCDFYQIAIQEFCKDLITEKIIDKYDPQKANFRTWVNRFFWKRFKYYIQKDTTPSQTISLDQLILGGWDMADPRNSQETFLSEQVFNYLQEDPDGILTRNYCCRKNCPGGSIQTILIKRYKGCSWQQIAQEIHCSTITIETLKSLSRCYNNWLKEISKYWRE